MYGQQQSLMPNFHLATIGIVFNALQISSFKIFRTGDYCKFDRVEELSSTWGKK